MTTTVLKSEDIVVAETVQVCEYGVYFTHKGQRIIVLLPDLCWRSPVVAREVFHVGDFIPVKILCALQDCPEQWRGSVREALPQQDNPYYKYVDPLFSSGTFIGNVFHVMPDFVHARLDDGCVIRLLKSNVGVAKGDRVMCKIDRVLPEKAELWGEILGREDTQGHP